MKENKFEAEPVYEKGMTPGHITLSVGREIFYFFEDDRVILEELREQLESAGDISGGGSIETDKTTGRSYFVPVNKKLTDLLRQLKDLEKANTQKSGGKESFKSGSEVLSYEEVKARLGRYGNISNERINYENGAWEFDFTVTEGNKRTVYPVVVPASQWRRRLEVNNLGDRVVSASYREGGNTDTMASEVAVFLVREHGDLENNLNRYLELKGGEPDTGGMEYEAFLLPGKKELGLGEVINEYMPEYAHEAFKLMREIALDPTKNLDDLERAIRDIKGAVMRFFTSEKFIAMPFGMRPQRLGENKEADTAIAENLLEHVDSRYADMIPYVHTAMQTLTQKVRDFIPTLLEEDSMKHVREAWTQVALEQGYENVKDFLNERLMNVWTTSSFHYSIEYPTDEDGFVPESVVKTVTNSYIYFSEFLNTNNFSGATVDGTDITFVIDDNGTHIPVLDSRAHTTGIVPLAMPPGMILPDSDLTKDMKELLFSGATNSIDRCIGRVRGIDDTKKHASVYGIIRSRTSVTLTQLLDYLEKKKNNSSEEKENDDKNEDEVVLTKVNRAEYIGRSATPEVIGGNMYSIALQHILHRAGIIAAKEGYNDIIQWYIDNKIIDDDQQSDDIYNKYTTNYVHELLIDATKGKFDKEKIKQMKEIIKFIEKKYVKKVDTQENNPWVKIVAYAKIGVKNIDRIRKYVEKGLVEKLRNSNDAVKKYEYFVEKNMGVFGALLAVLKDRDIATILIEKFNVSEVKIKKEDRSEEVKKVWSLEHGHLVALLGHYHSKRMLTEYEQ